MEATSDCWTRVWCSPSVARFVADQRTMHQVPHVFCSRILDLSVSWFYKWLGREPTDRQVRRGELDAAVKTAFDAGGGGEAGAVGAERHAVHRAGVAGERVADGLSGGRIPQPHRVVPTAGGEAGAVGAERHTGHQAGVAGQRLADRLAGVRVPQPHRVVVAAGGEVGAVGAERHAFHRAGVAGQRGADRFSVLRVPQPRCPVGAGGGEAA
jgi:hypothetical protein